MTITALMAIAHIIELSVCVDEVSSEVIGHRQAGIEINLHTTIECLVAHRSYAEVTIKPLVPLVIVYVIAPEGGVFHQFLDVGRIAVSLDLVGKSQHGHEHRTIVRHTVMVLF